VSIVRTKYGVETKIVILGDFNAQVGMDGLDNVTEENNESGDACANGFFGFAKTDDNGAELLTFCQAKQFKIMDSYFEREDGDYGTWAYNRSRNKGYNAVLDHILVSKELWKEVVTCGVYIPIVIWNTDHRMVEIDLGRCGVGKAEGRKKKSEQAKERATRQSINRHVLWCRLRMDPDKELPRMRDALEKIVEKSKESTPHNIEDDPEWGRHIKVNAKSILQILEAAITVTLEELFPGGVPANNPMKERHWNSEKREVKNLGGS
jgi:hypothetical protein